MIVPGHVNIGTLPLFNYKDYILMQGGIECGGDTTVVGFGKGYTVQGGAECGGAGTIIAYGKGYTMQGGVECGGAGKVGDYILISETSK